MPDTTGPDFVHSGNPRRVYKTARTVYKMVTKRYKMDTKPTWMRTSVWGGPGGPRDRATPRTPRMRTSPLIFNVANALGPPLSLQRPNSLQNDTKWLQNAYKPYKINHGCLDNASGEGLASPNTRFCIKTNWFRVFRVFSLSLKNCDTVTIFCDTLWLFPLVGHRNRCC